MIKNDSIGSFLYMIDIYTKFELDIRFTWFEIDRYRSIQPFVTQTTGSLVTSHWHSPDWIVLK